MPWSGFVIGRKYITEGRIRGSLGAGWLATVDSRIIRGVSKTDEETIEKIQELVDEIYGMDGDTVRSSTSGDG
jgi:hypothetical protein